VAPRVIYYLTIIVWITPNVFPSNLRANANSMVLVAGIAGGIFMMSRHLLHDDSVSEAYPSRCDGFIEASFFRLDPDKTSASSERS
jgi:hypothetical protein